MTSALLRSHAPSYRSPSELLVDLNAMLLPNMKRGMFITMFYGILHLPSGRFTFAGAGHNPLIHFRGDTGLQTLVGTRGIPLGLYPSKRFSEEPEHRAPADDGFLHTDGVNGDEPGPRSSIDGISRPPGPSAAGRGRWSRPPRG
jgi:sigma-B regulation protein RsbU (phosphoserine phosphatase)